MSEKTESHQTAETDDWLPVGESLSLAAGTTPEMRACYERMRESIAVPRATIAGSEGG